MALNMLQWTFTNILLESHRYHCEVWQTLSDWLFIFRGRNWPKFGLEYESFASHIPIASFPFVEGKHEHKISCVAFSEDLWYSIKPHYISQPITSLVGSLEILLRISFDEERKWSRIWVFLSVESQTWVSQFHFHFVQRCDFLFLRSVDNHHSWPQYT